MKVHLKHLTYLADFDLLKIIISSADRFPGLYRFNSAWKHEIERENYLKFLSFLETCHLAEQNFSWSKSQWLSAHERIYNLAFGPSGRDSERTDRKVGSLLKDKAQKWFQKANSLSLAIIDINQPTDEIMVDTTYYLMGSLIRFEEEAVHISYDHYQKKSLLSLRVPFSDVKAYIDATFSKISLSELFIKSEIIAHLDFDENERGILKFNQPDLNEYLIHFSGNAPIFGAINYDEILPIRFAKLIGVSNVSI